MPSTPADPLLPTTCLNARFRFSESHTASISPLTASTGPSLPYAAVSVSTPFTSNSRASPSPPPAKASRSCLFGRLPSTRLTAYRPLLPFGPSFRLVAKLLCPLLTPPSRSDPLSVLSASASLPQARRRSPEVSSATFAVRLPNLHPSPLMDMDFAVKRPLVR